LKREECVKKQGDRGGLLAAALSAAAFLLLLTLTVRDPRLLPEALARWSYFIVAALVLTWGVLAISCLRESAPSPLRLLRSSWMGLATALALTVLTGLAVDGHFRVLADETDQVNTARALFLHGEAKAPVQGYYGPDGSYKALEVFVPKRPLLFPFLGHLLHHLLGETEKNLFRFNLAVLFALLLLAYGVGKHFWGEVAGQAAMLLLLSNPAVALFARSAGFDLLSAFGFCATLALLYLCLRNPSERLFALLWVQLLLFAHVRYENLVYLPLIFGALFLLGEFGKERLRPALPLLAATPLFLLPLGWQFVLSRGQYENPEGVALFGAGHFFANTGKLLATQLDFNFAFQSVYGDLCLPLALVTAAVLLVAAARGKIRFRHPWQRSFALILALSAAANLLIFLSLVHGDITNRLSQRFFLTSFILFSQAPLALLFLPGRETRRWLLLAGSALLLLLYLPVAANRFAHGLYYPGIEFQRDFLAAYDKEKTLVLTPHPDRLCALGYGALLPSNFTAHRRWFQAKIDEGAWENVFVFQEVDSVQKRITAESRLYPNLKLRKIGILHLGPERYMKISNAGPD